MDAGSVQVLRILQLLLVLHFLIQQPTNVRVRALDHGVEGSRIAFRQIPALQPSDDGLH